MAPSPAAVSDPREEQGRATFHPNDLEGIEAALGRPATLGDRAIIASRYASDPDVLVGVDEVSDTGIMAMGLISTDAAGNEFVTRIASGCNCTEPPRAISATTRASSSSSIGAGCARAAARRRPTPAPAAAS